MSGNSIAAKVKAGLKKANFATGEGDNLIQLKQEIAGVDDPINPIPPTYNNITLVDAIIKNVDKSLIDGELIFNTDKTLVSNGDVEINQNDRILVNGLEFTAIMVNEKKPSDIALAYESVIRSL